MLKSKLDELLHNRIITEEEYDSFFKTMSVNERGEMIGVRPNNEASLKCDFNGNLIHGDPLRFLLTRCTPPINAGGIDVTFNTYGIMVCGVCEYWHWFTKDNITEYAKSHGHKPIEEASELEIWKMIAICSRYWETQYEEWYEKSMYELNVYRKEYGWDLWRSIKYV